MDTIWFKISRLEKKQANLLNQLSLHHCSRPRGSGGETTAHVDQPDSTPPHHPLTIAPPHPHPPVHILTVRAVSTQSSCEYGRGEKNVEKKRSLPSCRHYMCCQMYQFRKLGVLLFPENSQHKQGSASTGEMEQISFFLSSVHTKMKKKNLSVRWWHLFFFSSNFSRFRLHRGSGSIGEGRGTKCKLKISHRKCCLWPEKSQKNKI